MITNDAMYTCEVQSRIAMVKAAFKRKKTFHQRYTFKFKEETSKMVRLEFTCVWR